MLLYKKYGELLSEIAINSYMAEKSWYCPKKGSQYFWQVMKMTRYAPPEGKNTESVLGMNKLILY